MSIHRAALIFALVAGMGCSNDSAATPNDAGRKRHASEARRKDDAGDDDDAAAPPPASVLGTIDGSKFSTKSALIGRSSGYTYVFNQLPTLHHEVTLTDFSDSCGNGDVHGRILYFDTRRLAARSRN